MPFQQKNGIHRFVLGKVDTPAFAGLYHVQAVQKKAQLPVTVKLVWS
jgi:hypothetical protein